MRPKKRIRIWIPIYFILLVIWVTILPEQIDERIPKSVSEFAIQYQNVRKKGDAAMQELLTFYSWEGIPQQLRETITRSLYFELDTPINRISFRKWNAEKDNADFFPPNTQPNLQPEWVMTIYFDGDPLHVQSLPIGSDNQDWKIINSIQKTQ